MIRRPPRSTLFPYTSSSDLAAAVLSVIGPLLMGDALSGLGVNLPIGVLASLLVIAFCANAKRDLMRSEEHTSELQSLAYLVCRLLLEKKKSAECCTVLRLEL